MDVLSVGCHTSAYRFRDRSAFGVLALAVNVYRTSRTSVINSSRLTRAVDD
jgi:hypothetical protein